MKEPALDLVVAALRKIRETSDHLPRASRISLAQLQSVAPNKADLLAPIRERVRVCTKCRHLASSRTQTVFGVGNPDAELMFIGEAPGADEDKRGEPFVGRAGQLLTKIIETMGFSREQVYIANILKCRPDTSPGSLGNRPPTPLEMQTCRPYLVEQIDIIQPGLLASKSIAFGKKKSLGRHVASARATRTTDHRAPAELFFVSRSSGLQPPYFNLRQSETIAKASRDRKSHQSATAMPA